MSADLSADRVIARARAAIGARFRTHGRDPVHGLDCVGLAAWALDRGDVPTGYALRSGDCARLDAAIGAAGLACVEMAVPGDLVVLASGPGQLHLGIQTATGLIHADAMLRRVVERPLPLPWPLISAWRPSDGGA